MNRYLDSLADVFEAMPDRIAAVDEAGSVTYGEVDMASARIYRYLKERHIGKEDFVYIVMPKNRHWISCMIGVWKAGAAFVINEPDYPAERRAFIRADIDARLVLDMELFEEIMSSCVPLSGHEETGLHDAAFAIYTSGSTGRPKGVLHEYGNVDQICSVAEEGRAYPEVRHGLVPSLSFVATFFFVLSESLMGRTFYMISGELLRNQPELMRYIEEQKLGEIYLPPSYIRIYKNPAPSLEVVFTGSEPANGLYYEGGRPLIRNIYSMSEAGFPVLTTCLSRAFDEAPAGKPVVDGLDLMLIDDGGNRIEGPGMGELCFRNEYVRGYINLPEKTAEAFVHGVYHTGDLCRRDENGIYYVAGRKDDMFKINGNRIEPAEIEAAVRRLSGLETVVAKGFNETSRQYICLYYLKSEAEKLKIFADGKLEMDREKLKAVLPPYMMPAYYIPLEAFPLNLNGKIARKELRSPDASVYAGKNNPPRNEGERDFCRAMAKLLGLPSVGRDDDFFQVGGDSIKAIQLVQMCGGYSLTVRDVYAFRTPELLARSVKKKEGGAEDAERMTPGFRQENLSGSAFLDAFVHGVTSKSVITLKKDVNIPLLERALLLVYRKYPFYQQHLELENGRLYYVRDADAPRIFRPAEAPEKEDRIRVIAEGNTLDVRIPHAFTDGFGMKLFLQLLLGTYAELLQGVEAAVSEAPAYCPGHYYDIFSEDYSAYGGETPDIYKAFAGSYRLPDEIGGRDTGKRFCYTVKVRRDRIPSLSEEAAERLSAVGGETTLAVGDMVARAIRAVYPDAESVGCRTSVNLRTLFHHEDSLKNMSFALAVFFPGEDSLRQLTEAIKPEVLKWQLMKFRLKIEGKLDDPEDQSVVSAIISPTFAITSVVDSGKGYPDIVSSVTDENPSPIPLLVMIRNEGEDMHITFVQKFEDRACFDTFCQYIS